MTISFGKLEVWIARVAVACLGIATIQPSIAHNGPEHEIEELNDRIAKEGQSADLLLQRAIEFQVLGKLAEALKDLERAAVLDPDSVTIQGELGRTYFGLGKTNEALQTVSRALSFASTGPQRGSLLVNRAEFLRARKELARALADTEEAIRNDPSNVEWYLLRSQLQAQLKVKKSERITGLAEAIQRTGSGVLEGEWVDALIEGSQYPAALEKIEAELAASRLKAAWQIRRARVYIATSKNAEAKADLEAALSELGRRVPSTSTDPSLLVDRGLARDLLGNAQGALEDYEKARDKGCTEYWLSDRIKALKEKAKEKD